MQNDYGWGINVYPMEQGGDTEPKSCFRVNSFEEFSICLKKTAINQFEETALWAQWNGQWHRGITFAPGEWIGRGGFIDFCGVATESDGDRFEVSFSPFVLSAIESLQPDSIAANLQADETEIEMTYDISDALHEILLDRFGQLPETMEVGTILSRCMKVEMGQLLDQIRKELN